MSDDLASQAKRKIVGRYPDWIKTFDADEYLQNRPMIEKLHEEKQLALATNLGLEQKVRDLSEQVHQLELENQVLSSQLIDSEQRSTVVFALSLVAAILVGIGVNIATDNPYTWAGWIMVVAAVVIEILVFYMTVQRRKKQNV